MKSIKVKSSYHKKLGTVNFNEWINRLTSQNNGYITVNFDDGRSQEVPMVYLTEIEPGINAGIKIYKRFADSVEIKETTWEDAISKLEGHEYWQPGEAKRLLEDGAVVWNPFCSYSINPELLKI